MDLTLVEPGVAQQLQAHLMYNADRLLVGLIRWQSSLDLQSFLLRPAFCCSPYGVLPDRIGRCSFLALGVKQTPGFGYESPVVVLLQHLTSHTGRHPHGVADNSCTAAYAGLTVCSTRTQLRVQCKSAGAIAACQQDAKLQ